MVTENGRKLEVLWPSAGTIALVKKILKKSRSGRRGDPVSLHPLTLAQALGAAVRVKLSDVKKLEAAERATKKRAKRGSR